MRKLKVTVISMDAVPNYGSVLQAFATKNIFEKYECDVTFVDYAREDVRYDNLSKTWSNGNPIKSLIMMPTIRRWKKVFRRFREDNLNLTEHQYTSDEDFNKHVLVSDIFCTGSDQVWNSKWNHGIIRPLYLSFAPKESMKIAFSASFGQDRLQEEEINATKALINEYRYISVREESAVRILKEQYGYKNAIHVLDPTLMISGNEWRNYAPKVSKAKPYILIYNLNRSKEFDKYAKELSKRTGLELVRFCTRYDQFYRPGKSLFIPEVFEFISLIDNAKYVLTDSFHATAFSMNMHTEPICVYPKEFGGRIESFLKLTKSENCHIRSYNDFDVLNGSVDFSEVDKIVEKERHKANVWLEKVLQDAVEYQRDYEV